MRSDADSRRNARTLIVKYGCARCPGQFSIPREGMIGVDGTGNGPVL